MSCHIGQMFLFSRQSLVRGWSRRRRREKERVEFQIFLTVFLSSRSISFFCFVFELNDQVFLTVRLNKRTSSDDRLNERLLVWILRLGLLVTFGPKKFEHTSPACRVITHLKYRITYLSSFDRCIPASQLHFFHSNKLLYLFLPLSFTSLVCILVCLISSLPFLLHFPLSFILWSTPYFFHLGFAYFYNLSSGVLFYGRVFVVRFLFLHVYVVSWSSLLFNNVQRVVY